MNDFDGHCSGGGGISFVFFFVVNKEKKTNKQDIGLFRFFLQGNILPIRFVIYLFFFTDDDQ